MPYADPTSPAAVASSRRSAARWAAKNRERVLASARAYAQEYQAKNPAEVRRSKAASKKANPETTRRASQRYYLRNKEVICQRRAARRSANPGRVHAPSVKHYAARKQRSPLWADAEAIRWIYEVARAWRLAGFDVHVDHQLPLQGKLVSGLHVHQNLTIMTAQANRSKAARYKPWA